MQCAVCTANICVCVNMTLELFNHFQSSFGSLGSSLISLNLRTFLFRDLNETIHNVWTGMLNIPCSIFKATKHSVSSQFHPSSERASQRLSVRDVTGRSDGAHRFFNESTDNADSSHWGHFHCGAGVITGLDEALLPLNGGNDLGCRDLNITVHFHISTFAIAQTQHGDTLCLGKADINSVADALEGNILVLLQVDSADVLLLCLLNKDGRMAESAILVGAEAHAFNLFNSGTPQSKKPLLS